MSSLRERLIQEEQQIIVDYYRSLHFAPPYTSYQRADAIRGLLADQLYHNLSDAEVMVRYLAI